MTAGVEREGTDRAGVLPKTPPSSLRSLDDLLTPEDRERLQRDLSEMARKRRRAEAEAAWIPMG